MSLVRYRSQNHPQQVDVRGAKDNVDDRGTDPMRFAALDAVYGFTLDVAAAAHNAKCERYFDKEIDGLMQSWGGEAVWCNPPYSNIGAWVAKAWDEWRSANPPALIVMLLPANRTEQGWWQDLVEPYRDNDEGLEVLFLRGRLRFVRANATAIGPNERPPFGCCLLIWSTR